MIDLMVLSNPKRKKTKTKEFKKMSKKSKKKHISSNPVKKALKMISKENIISVSVDTALITTGFIGQNLIESNVLPLIPGYTTLTGPVKTGARLVSAVAVPVLLAFLLPKLKIKQATKYAKMLGFGMVSSVIISEIKSNNLLPLSAISPALPVNRSYGLASGSPIVPKAKNYL